MKKIILFSAAICLSVMVSAQSVSTYAGTGDPGFSTSNKAILDAKFDNPYGVAFDSKGRLFVTDYNNHVVLELFNGLYNRRSGDFTSAGYMNTGEGQPKHSYPMGVAIGEKDTVFVVDNGSNTIRRIQIPASGSLYPVKTLAGGGPSGSSGASGYKDDFGTNARFDFPTGIAISPDKKYLLVTDKGNQLIRRIEVSGSNYGKVSTFAGKQGVAGDDDGTLASATFNDPEGILIDVNGDVYVADYSGGIRKISGGMVTTVVSESSLDNPTAIVKVGNVLFIADGCNIKRKDLSSGSLVRFAGSDTACDFADGNGGAAQFQGIGGMTLAPDNKSIFLADQYNNRIRKVTITDLPSAIDDLVMPAFSIYPNPAQNRVHISGIPADAVIILSDLTGRVIKQETALNAVHTICTENVPSGIYLVLIRTEKNTFTGRVLISR